MAKPLLQILRQGLLKLKARDQKRREDITAALQAQVPVSSADEDWLDKAGNHIEEEQLIDQLDRASDTERAVKRLSKEQKGLVAQLKELASGVATQVSKKRKKPDNVYKPTPKVEQAKEEVDEPPKSSRKQQATLKQRLEILDWFHTNGTGKGGQTKTAKHFADKYPNLKIKQLLVSDWLANEAEWHERWEGSTENERNVKRVRQTQHPAVTEMMDLWVAKAVHDNVLLTGDVLRAKWTQFSELAGILMDKRLTLSNGWLQKFKASVGLKGIKRHGEAASADPESVERERVRLHELLRNLGYALCDTWNMDETGLFWVMVPDRGLATTTMAGVKGKKDHLTYTLATNADGSETRPAFIIGKANKPRAFGGKTGPQLGFDYVNNAKAWMTMVLYQAWLRHWDDELDRSGRKILLLQDNFSGHVPPEGLRNIRVENFEPNLTAHVQPMDQGIICTFKAHYRKAFITQSMHNYDDGVTPAKIHDLNQLQAMRMAETAWSAVSPSTIAACWKKAGILPQYMPVNANASSESGAPANLVVEAEKAVEDALDALESRGVLARKNRLTLQDLLNPVDESAALSKTSDKEIFDSVMEAVEAWENIDIFGGDDGVEGEPAQARPTPRAILEAAAVIQCFLEAEPGDSARALDSQLTALAYKLRQERERAMQESMITAFFPRIASGLI